MDSSLLSLAVTLLFTILSISRPTTLPSIEKNALSDTFEEIVNFSKSGKDIIMIDVEGNRYQNPDLSMLQALPEELFSDHRVKLTLVNYSDDDRCSTEVVLLNEEEQIISNYSLNACSAFGWIIFTPNDCFNIDLYHDAGLEAPLGGAIEGKVDWTFTFDNTNQLAGTYYDGGVANMIRVASPCYKENKFTYLANNRERLEKEKSTSKISEYKKLLAPNSFHKLNK